MSFSSERRASCQTTTSGFAPAALHAAASMGWRVAELPTEVQPFHCAVTFDVTGDSPRSAADLVARLGEEFGGDAVHWEEDRITVHTFQLGPDRRCAAWLAQVAALAVAPDWPLLFIAIGAASSRQPDTVLLPRDHEVDSPVRKAG